VPSYARRHNPGSDTTPGSTHHPAAVPHAQLYKRAAITSTHSHSHDTTGWCSCWAWSASCQASKSCACSIRTACHQAAQLFYPASHSPAQLATPTVVRRPSQFCRAPCQPAGRGVLLPVCTRSDAWHIMRMPPSCALHTRHHPACLKLTPRAFKTSLQHPLQHPLLYHFGCGFNCSPAEQCTVQTCALWQGATTTHLIRGNSLCDTVSHLHICMRKVKEKKRESGQPRGMDLPHNTAAAIVIKT
jgi:hypothetical protein